MADQKTIELLINTKSRSGKQALPDIVKAFTKAGVTFDAINAITDMSLLPETLQGIKDRSPDILVTASGDGTVSDVVDYLAGTKIKLGFIPLGTTNNFARSLGIPLDLTSAIDVVAKGRTRRIALGQVGQDYFANVAGIGLSADIAAAVTSEKKQKYGRLAYALTAVPLLMRHKSFFVTLSDKDGELQAHFETHQVIVANGRFHAGREIAMDADLKKPELVVFKLGGPSKISLLWHMLDFYLGRRKTVYHASYFIGRDMLIKTDRPQPIELDGEVKLVTPISARVHPKAVTVFIDS